MLADTPFGPYILLFLVISFVCVLLTRQRTLTAPDIPWVNYNEGEYFGRFRAKLRTTLDYQGALNRSYQQYSKVSKSCILPALGRNIVLLPRSCAEWIITTPDNLISNLEAIKDELQPDHALLQPDIVHNPTHHTTISGPLTRNLASLIPDIYDEVASSFDEIWGTDTVNWKEVCVFESIIKIVGRVSNRVLIGKELCKDQLMLDTALMFAQLFSITGQIIKQVPPSLRPVLAPPLTFFNHWYARKYSKILEPEIRKRQQISAQEKHKPNDFLQWTVDLANDSPLASEREPRTIALRLLVVNFAAIHTSTMTITNNIFDLVSAKATDVQELQSELQEALANNHEKWDKGLLHQLVKLDSSMRESARLGSFVSTGLARRITAPEGLTAPDGTHCPFGSTVAVPTNGIHKDPSLYDDADRYMPFRFVNMRQVSSTNELDADSGKRDTTRLIKNASLSFVSVSPEYHPFGVGRHACPGRFFAAHELKLMLAYILQHYEIEHQETRPQSKFAGSTLLPPMRATASIRRKPDVSKT